MTSFSRVPVDGGLDSTLRGGLPEFFTVAMHSPPEIS